MNIRLKLAVFYLAVICALVLFYIKFGQSIKNNSLLDFIGIPTIVVVVILHGIAHLIRSLLVRRHCHSAGISQGNQTWLCDLAISDKPLFVKIRKSLNKISIMSLLLTAVMAGIVFSLLRIFQKMPKEEMAFPLMQYWILMTSYAAGMILLFFAIHFFFMSILLEYKSKIKAALVTLLSFTVTFVSAVFF